MVTDFWQDKLVEYLSFIIFPPASHKSTSARHITVHCCTRTYCVVFICTLHYIPTTNTAMTDTLTLHDTHIPIFFGYYFNTMLHCTPTPRSDYIHVTVRRREGPTEALRLFTSTWAKFVSHIYSLIQCHPIYKNEKENNHKTFSTISS